MIKKNTLLQDGIALKNNFKTIDNVLSKNDYKKLYDLFFNAPIPWFYNGETVTNIEDDTYFFTHSIYRENKINSETFDFVYDIFKTALGIRSCHMIRANLTLNTSKEIITAMHTDCDPYRSFYGDKVSFKTAIFYLNTNNGSTFLEKDIEVKAIANRILIFDGNTLHCNKFSTDTKRRIILNFNYV
jgi:hypothetical protein